MVWHPVPNRYAFYYCAIYDLYGSHAIAAVLFGEYGVSLYFLFAADIHSIYFIPCSHFRSETRRLRYFPDIANLSTVSVCSALMERDRSFKSDAQQRSPGFCYGALVGT